MVARLPAILYVYVTCILNSYKVKKSITIKNYSVTFKQIEIFIQVNLNILIKLMKENVCIASGV